MKLEFANGTQLDCESAYISTGGNLVILTDTQDGLVSLVKTESSAIKLYDNEVLKAEYNGYTELVNINTNVLDKDTGIVKTITTLKKPTVEEQVETLQANNDKLTKEIEDLKALVNQLMTQ